jgi:hypothetical protein
MYDILGSIFSAWQAQSLEDQPVSTYAVAEEEHHLITLLEMRAEFSVTQIVR